MRKIITVIALIYFNSTLSQSLSGIENFILASQQDQNLLSEKYFKPLFNSMQVSMGEGWAKSAKTHKKLEKPRKTNGKQKKATEKKNLKVFISFSNFFCAFH